MIPKNDNDEFKIPTIDYHVLQILQATAGEAFAVFGGDDEPIVEERVRVWALTEERRDDLRPEEWQRSIQAVVHRRPGMMVAERMLNFMGVRYPDKHASISDWMTARADEVESKP